MTQGTLDFSEKPKSGLSILDRVMSIMERYPKTRDNYASLDCYFYQEYINMDAPNSTMYEFFQMMHNKDIPSLESVHRARRKIEEMYPHLRGDTYNERHAKTAKIAKTINITPTQTIESI